VIHLPSLSPVKMIQSTTLAMVSLRLKKLFGFVSCSTVNGSVFISVTEHYGMRGQLWLSKRTYLSDIILTLPARSPPDNVFMS